MRKKYELIEPIPQGQEERNWDDIFEFKPSTPHLQELPPSHDIEPLIFNCVICGEEQSDFNEYESTHLPKMHPKVVYNCPFEQCAYEFDDY